MDGCSAFAPSLIVNAKSPPWSSGLFREKRACRQARIATPVARLSNSPSSRPAALAGGIAVLGTVFFNRVFLTPLEALPPPQSRADLLAVASAAALMLYGLGRADVAEREQGPVELDGVDVRVGLEADGGSELELASRMDWTSRSIFRGIPAVKSFAVVVDGKEVCRVGRFRDANCAAFVRDGGIADGVLQSGERAYLADLKVVPVKDVEFGFFPEKCQVCGPAGRERCSKGGWGGIDIATEVSEDC